MHDKEKAVGLPYASNRLLNRVQRISEILFGR